MALQVGQQRDLANLLGTKVITITEVGAEESTFSFSTTFNTYENNVLSTSEERVGYGVAPNAVIESWPLTA